MKKTLILSFFLLLCVLMSAQTKDYFKNKQHELRLSIGSVSEDYYQYSYFGYGGYYYGYYGFGSSLIDQSSYDLLSFYSDSKKTAGVFSLSYYYHAPWFNGRFSFGGALSYNGFTQDYRDRLSRDKIGNLKEHNLVITPNVRYAWVSKSFIQLYSGIGCSFYTYMSKDKLSLEDYQRDNSITEYKTSFLVTPIGLSIGNDIFGFGELNIGGRSGVFVGGFGYRF